MNFKPVADAIFNGGLVGENGAPGINSDIITVDGDRAFVLRISEHKPEAVKPLADVQEQVKALVQHNKAEQQAKVDAEKLLVDLKAAKVRKLCRLRSEIWRAENLKPFRS